MTDLIVFGGGKIAEVILHYFKLSHHYNVIALTIDKAFIRNKTCFGLPVYPFETIQDYFPPSKVKFFVALGYQNLNQLRTQKCLEAKNKGYTLVSCIGPNAHVPDNCVFGENCFFMDQSMIHPCVKFGNNVFVWSGVMIGHHSVIGNNCWFTSSSQVAGGVTIGDNCFFSINSTIGNKISLGRDCFIGANALVTQSSKDESVFLGEASKPYRLTSHQFLRMTKFDQK